MTQFFAMMLVALTAAPPPTYDELQRQFAAGRYQEVADGAAAAAEASPGARNAVLYLAGLSRQKLRQSAEARALFAQLAEAGEGDAWRYVGQSAAGLLQLTEPGGEGGLPFDPLEMANRAVSINPNLFEAQYQLGHAHAFKGDYGNAAAAFERAAQLSPTMPVAHYYAGIAYYRIKRIDLMANHFESFLRLAPDAPERGEVESIMRTVRGR
jgi:tetratricopeptide (TPR) repeat protein